MRTSEPPSVLKVRRSKSVVTVIFSPTADGAAAVAGGAPAGWVVAVAAEGTAAGTVLGGTPEAPPAGAVAVAVGLGWPKPKVGLLPL